jgi:hypothetical protein
LSLELLLLLLPPPPPPPLLLLLSVATLCQQAGVTGRAVRCARLRYATCSSFIPD